MENNLKDLSLIFPQQQDILSEESLQKRKKTIDLFVSYKISSYLSTGIKLGRIFTRQKITLTNSLSQNSPLKKVDHIYLIPCVKIKTPLGQVQTFSFLEQKINSQKEFNHQNFSFDDIFFSYGLTYTFSVDNSFQSSVVFFNSKDQFNDPSYDSKKNKIFFNLSNNLKSQIFSSITFSHLSNNNQSSLKLKKSLKLSFTYSFSRYQDLKFSFILLDQTDSAENLNHKQIFKFFVSYTFNFFKKIYTENNYDFLEERI